MAAVAVAVALAGCTMCPDPYDYSGPVPNGSAPQNDFRARSNGILPIGAAPMPWPPIVKGDTDGGSDVHGRLARQGVSCKRGGTPTLADPAIEQAGGTEADGAIEPVSMLVDDGTDQEPGDGANVGGESAAHDGAEDDAAAAAAETVSAEVNAPAHVEPPTVVLNVELPTLAETPGWRPRRDP